MAELSKIFKSNDLYEAWRDNKDIPSNVMAVVLDETGNDVEKVAFGTNNIDGQYKTYEVAKGEPKEYASNNNVYVNFGADTNIQFFMKKNLYEEFDYPEKEGDVFVTSFQFYLSSINYPVDIENVKLYFGDMNSTPTTIQWINIQENNTPIQYEQLSNGVYKCTVQFRNDMAYNQNFFISYTLPSSSSIQFVDKYIIAYWKSGVVTQ